MREKNIYSWTLRKQKKKKWSVSYLRVATADSHQTGTASLLGECVSVCLHKRGSAGFPGSGNIQYVNTASGSTSGAKDRPWMEESDRVDEPYQITAALTSSGCERITEECDVDP